MLSSLLALLGRGRRRELESGWNGCSFVEAGGQARGNTSATALEDAVQQQICSCHLVNGIFPPVKHALDGLLQRAHAGVGRRALIENVLVAWCQSRVKRGERVSA